MQIMKKLNPREFFEKIPEIVAEGCILYVSRRFLQEIVKEMKSRPFKTYEDYGYSQGLYVSYTGEIIDLSKAYNEGLYFRYDEEKGFLLIGAKGNHDIFPTDFERGHEVYIS